MQAGEVMIPLAFFGVVFGLYYLYISSRNKERIALIEKGADASIFNLGKRGSSWKVIVINFAFLMIGVGVGVLLAAIITEYSTLDEEAVYPALIFILAGTGLYVGYTQTKKAVDND